jgi:AcrR family transcriptional regulator
MVRQARSEATRQKIINAAVDLFSEVGYQSTGLGDIIERAEMTKGALYYHFDSKESLATAIIEDGDAALQRSFDSVSEPSAPALEIMIHGVFVTADLFRTDKIARTATQLLRVFGKFNDAAVPTFRRWQDLMITHARQASVEGDLREGLDPDVVGETIVAAMAGAELISTGTCDGADLRQRIARTWEVLLPAIASDESLPYFQEFLARESLRHAATLSLE